MPLTSMGEVHESSMLVGNPLPVKDSTMLGTAEVKDKQHWSRIAFVWCTVLCATHTTPLKEQKLTAECTWATHKCTCTLTQVRTCNVSTGLMTYSCLFLSSHLWRISTKSIKDPRNATRTYMQTVQKELIMDCQSHSTASGEGADKAMTK